jgi:hypothetical protein
VALGQESVPKDERGSLEGSPQHTDGPPKEPVLCAGYYPNRARVSTVESATYHSLKAGARVAISADTAQRSPTLSDMLVNHLNQCRGAAPENDIFHFAKLTRNSKMGQLSLRLFGQTAYFLGKNFLGRVFGQGQTTGPCPKCR